MIRLLLLAALLIAPVAAERSLAPGIAPEPFTAERFAADVNRIAGGNLTLEEWVVVLALGHGYNVTRDGIVTLDDGEKIDISSPAPFGFVGPVTAGIDPATRRRW